MGKKSGLTLQSGGHNLQDHEIWTGVSHTLSAIASDGMSTPPQIERLGGRAFYAC